jgi:hypothetical protein
VKPTHYLVTVSGPVFTVRVPVDVGAAVDAVEAVKRDIKAGDYDDPDEWMVQMVGAVGPGGFQAASTT